MKKRITFVSAVVLAAAVVALVTGSRASVARAASKPQLAISDLDGGCAFKLAANNGQTLVMAGMLDFDGNGNVEGSMTQTTAGGSGTPSFVPLSGTYTTNGDGTGTISFTAGSASYSLAYAADAGPAILQLILTNSGMPGIGSCSF